MPIAAIDAVLSRWWWLRWARRIMGSYQRGEFCQGRRGHFATSVRTCARSAKSCCFTSADILIAHQVLARGRLPVEKNGVAVAGRRVRCLCNALPGVANLVLTPAPFRNSQLHHRSEHPISRLLQAVPLDCPCHLDDELVSVHACAQKCELDHWHWIKTNN